MGGWVGGWVGGWGCLTQTLLVSSSFFCLPCALFPGGLGMRGEAGVDFEEEGGWVVDCCGGCGFWVGGWVDGLGGWVGGWVGWVPWSSSIFSSCFFFSSFFSLSLARARQALSSAL